MTIENQANFPIEWHNEADKKEVWSRQQIADRYPDPVTPLFGDIWFSNLGPAIKRMADILDVLKSGFIPRYIIINGYVYGNLDPRNMSKPKLVRLLFQLYHKADYVEKNYEHELEMPHLRRVAEFQNVNLGNLSLVELDSHLNQLETAFEDWMVTQNITFFFTEYGIKIFAIFTRLLFGRADPNLYLKLTSGFENESLIMNRELDLMASMIQEDEHKRLFEKYSGIELWEKIQSESSMENFLKEFQKFLVKNGIRTTHWDFVYPTWKEAPEIPLDILKGFVLSSSLVEDKLTEQELEREKATQMIKSKFNNQFFKKPFQSSYFKWMDLAQRYTILKERRQISMYKIWFPIRLTVLEIGTHLLELSIIEDSSEIFFLRRHEISEILLAISKNEFEKDCPSDYRKLINERRQAWNNQFELEPPIEIEWQKVIKRESIQEIKGLSGTPASVGVVTAKSNIILRPQEMGKFKEGDILVTKYTNPSWTPLFALASGVITEAGGMLSHAAIVAREYGIPAVVGLRNATKLIKDQEMIVLDGNNGTVSKT